MNKDVRIATGKRRRVVWVSAGQREALDSLVRRITVVADLRRARGILLLANGTSVPETGRIVRMQRCHLYKWAEGFRQRGSRVFPTANARGDRRSFSAEALSGATKEDNK